MPNMCVSSGVCVDATANNNGRSFKSSDNVLVSSVKLNGLRPLLVNVNALEAPLNK